MDTTAEPGNAAGPRAAAARTSRDEADQKPIGPQQAASLEELLMRPVVLNYVPRLPIQSARYGDRLYFDFYFDIEWMCRDDSIQLPLQWVMGPAAHAEWEIEARTHAEAIFVAQQLQWFWWNARDQIQEEGYPFGWAGGELVYDIHDNLLVQSKFTGFNPRDIDPLVKDGKPVGVLVNNTGGGESKLHAWREDRPNKAYWYAHRARRGQRRGQSQVFAAYRPWLRLSGRDGGEELVDLGFYRLGVPIVAVDHPNEPYKAVAGQQGIASFGGLTHTRDEARNIAETVKSGAGVAISSQRDGKGDRKWDLRVMATGVNGEQLISYVEYLERKCSKGVGVPPELFQAAQTGSGYSGRAIPLEGFLTAQQRPVNDLTRSWFDQIGKQLLKWNFGPDAWARVTPLPLLASYKKNAWDKPGQPPQPSPGIGAMMSTLPWASTSSRFLVRATGECIPLQSAAVSAPAMSWLSTEASDTGDDLDAFVAKLAESHGQSSSRTEWDSLEV